MKSCSKNKELKEIQKIEHSPGSCLFFFALRGQHLGHLETGTGSAVQGIQLQRLRIGTQALLR